MRYQVSIDIDEVDDDGMRNNIDSHQIVLLSDSAEAVKVWNWTIGLIEAMIAAVASMAADSRLFG